MRRAHEAAYDPASLSSDEEGDEDEGAPASEGAALSDGERNAVARKAALKLWSKKPEIRKIVLKATACFGEMDWNNDAHLSVDEFCRSWFRGRDMSAAELSSAMALLGADSELIAQDAFVFHIVEKYVAQQSALKRAHFEKLLTDFMQEAHRENEMRVALERASALEVTVSKLRAFSRRAKLHAAHSQAEAKETGTEMDRLAAENAALTLELKRARAPTAAPEAMAAAAGGGGGAAAAALQARVDALEQEAGEARARELAAVAARDASTRAAAALREENAELRATIDAERERTHETADYGPLCLKHVPHFRAALCDIPGDLKRLQNALDDLTGAMRVLVRTRPFLCGNPDEKKVGMRKKKYYRRAQKRRRAAPDGSLSAAARAQFEAARLQDGEAADCVVADGERCTVRVEASGTLVREFTPLSDVMPYGGPFLAAGHPLAAPAATGADIWARIEPLVKVSVLLFTVTFTRIMLTI